MNFKGLFEDIGEVVFILVGIGYVLGWGSAVAVWLVWG